MPVYFTGYVMVDSVRATRDGLSSFQSGVSFGTLSSPYVGAAIVKSWTSVERDIEQPVENTVYFLEGKVTNSDGLMIIEALRMHSISDSTEIKPPQIQGTAIYIGKDGSNLMFDAKTYASKINGQYKMQCRYAEHQYSNFIAKIRPQSEIYVYGLIERLDLDKIILTHSEFSFLSRQLYSKQVPTPSASKSSPGENGFSAKIIERKSTATESVKNKRTDDIFEMEPAKNQQVASSSKSLNESAEDYEVPIKDEPQDQVDGFDGNELKETSNSTPSKKGKVKKIVTSIKGKGKRRIKSLSDSDDDDFEPTMKGNELAPRGKGKRTFKSISDTDEDQHEPQKRSKNI